MEYAESFVFPTWTSFTELILENSSVDQWFQIPGNGEWLQNHLVNLLK